MAASRTFSTRELAQMWNVSESTIKRWADSGVLKCTRTPGGHRKFSLEDICGFQMQRGFEANGVLPAEPWESPEIEQSLNQKNYVKVREVISYLAIQNQRMRIRELLEQLYLRGLGLVEIYDHVLIPVSDSVDKGFRDGSYSLGQAQLIGNNLEEAMFYVFPRLIRRRPTGKTGLCGSPSAFFRIGMNGISHVLEVEGWECLNLGNQITFSAMADMVESEPINLVCVIQTAGEDSTLAENKDYSRLVTAAASYRIPVTLVGSGFSDSGYRSRFGHDEYFGNLREFRRYVSRYKR